MKRKTFMKSTLCLLMALVCNVSWAQTSSWFKMGASTTSLSDGDYVLVAKSDKGTGPVFYDPSVGKPYRYDVSKIVAEGHAVQSKYVWTIDETTIDGVQHITVTNHDDNTKAFPVDGAKNQNFTGSGTASLKTEMYTADGVDYIVLTLDNEAIGYVHANAPGGNPCLSYWNKGGDGASCIKFTFFPVNALTNEERLTYNVGDGKYNDRAGSSWRNGWTSTNVGKPSFTITAANSKNNMNAGSIEFIGMRPGDTKSCVYTLTLGETFTGYSFEAKSTNTAPDTNNPAHVITINGEQTTVGTEWTTFKVDAYGTSTTFTLAGSNSHDLYIRNVKFEQNADALETINAAVTANTSMNVYALQRYLGLVQNAGTGLTGDGQISCNFPANTSQESGNAYANLLDGTYTTFFHSGYNGTRGDGSAHYLQFALNKFVKNFRFYFKKRSQNNDNRPKEILIEGSVDGNTFEEIETISDGMPSGAAPTDYYSDEITASKAYKYLRFTVKKTHSDQSSDNPFFTFSEFYILPNTPKVAATFDAVRAYRAGATVATATALNEMYVWNTELSSSMPKAGKDYYFYADTKQSNNTYVARYLYNNNGALATSQQLTIDNKYAWTASQPADTEYFTFQNVGDNTKYLGYGNSGNGLTVNTTAVQLDINPSYAVHAGSVGVQRIGNDNNGKYMVTKADGTSFNRNSGKSNDGSWCSDYVFVPADLYEGVSSFTISGSADATATFNGETKALPATFYLTETVADENATVVITSNDPTRTPGTFTDGSTTTETLKVTSLTGHKNYTVNFNLNLEDGGRYYLYAYTQPTSGNYVNRYLYKNPSGNVATSADLVDLFENYIWTVTKDGTGYKLTNGAGGKLRYNNTKRFYLDNNTGDVFGVDPTNVATQGKVSIVSGSNVYVATKSDGSAFNQLTNGQMVLETMVGLPTICLCP